MAAAAEKDPAKATAAWESAASAFLAIAEDPGVTKGVASDAAYAAILAWKNALSVDPRVATRAPSTDTDFDKVPTPRLIPPREQALLRTLEIYIAHSPPPDELASAKFLRANTLRRYDHLDKAIPIFLDIVDAHRDLEVAEYAANLVLDSYNRLQRYDEMIAFAEKLRLDKKFLATRPDLAATLAQLRMQTLRVRGVRLEGDARATRDLATYDRCGDEYIAIADEPGIDERSHAEVLYNAGVCYTSAGSIARAAAVYRILIAKHPHSSLAGRAMARLGTAEANVGHYREAIDALEKYFTKYPGEKDAFHAASDAIFYARGLGDHERVNRIGNFVIKTFAAKRPREAAEVAVILLEVSPRNGAVAAAQRVARHISQLQREPLRALHAARTIVAATCPNAPVDELCSKPRAPGLDRTTHDLLSYAGDRTSKRLNRPTVDDKALADWATLTAIDLDLESVLAIRVPAPKAPTVGNGAVTDPSAGPASIAAEPVARAYERLILDATDPGARIAAHARLGTLQRHLGDRDQALVALRACVAESRKTTLASDWLARCERDLTAMKEPDLDILPERLAPPSAGPVIALELPRP